MKSEETKKALSAALKGLLEKKPISKITITEITDSCGISRMTFYYHFKDIYDLVEWTCREEAHIAIAAHDADGTWQKGFLILLEAMQAHKSFFMSLYRSIDRERLEWYVKPAVEKIIMDVVETQGQSMKISPRGKNRIAVFYTYAFLGVVMEWIDQDMKTPPKDVIAGTAAIIQADFRDSLESMSRFENEGE